MLTAFYSVRLIYLTFITSTNVNKVIYRGAEESSLSITFPLLLLAFGSIFVGYLVKEVVLFNTIYPIVSNFIKITPFVLSLLGMLLGFVVYSSSTVFRWGAYKKFEGHRVLYAFFNSAWQFNYIINNFFINYI